MHINNYLKFIFLIKFLFFGEVYSNVLFFDVPQKKIELNENSTEPELFVYVYSNTKKNLVLKITGPTQKVILQKILRKTAK